MPPRPRGRCRSPCSRADRPRLRQRRSPAARRRTTGSPMRPARTDTARGSVVAARAEHSSGWRDQLLTGAAERCARPESLAGPLSILDYLSRLFLLTLAQPRRHSKRQDAPCLPSTRAWRFLQPLTSFAHGRCRPLRGVQRRPALLSVLYVSPSTTPGVHAPAQRFSYLPPQLVLLQLTKLHSSRSLLFPRQHPQIHVFPNDRPAWTRTAAVPSARLYQVDVRAGIRRRRSWTSRQRPRHTASGSFEGRSWTER